MGRESLHFKMFKKMSLTSKETIKKHLIYFEKGRILFNLVFDVLYEAIKPVGFLSDVPPRVFLFMTTFDNIPDPKVLMNPVQNSKTHIAIGSTSTKTYPPVN